MKELTKEEFELLSEDEKLEYITHLNNKLGTVEDLIKELKEISENIHKRRIQNSQKKVDDVVTTVI